MAQGTPPKSARNKKIYELREKGMSAIELGKKYKISRQAVYEISKRYAKPNRHRV
jgi:Mor family transcriptional regulator